MSDSAAKAVGNLVLAQDGGHALDIALGGCGEDGALLRCHEIAQLVGKRRNRPVKAQSRTRAEGNFAEGVVFVEHIDGAKLIEIEARMRREK